MPRKRLIEDGKPVAGKKAKGKPKTASRKAKKDGMAVVVGTLCVERVAVSKLQPAAYNPRRDLQPGDEEYESIKRSIGTFGCVDSLVWNKRTGNLVAGHQRLKVLITEFDTTEVDVSVVDLPLADEKVLNVALNNIAGEWDELALASLLSDLQQEEGHDVGVTGFSDDELDAMLVQAELEAAAGDPGQATVVSHSFKVVVTCPTAKKQKAVVALLEKRGITCHTLTRDG